MADFLSLLNVEAPKTDWNMPRRQIFDDLSQRLDLLIAIPKQIPETVGGKAYKIGMSGRKPNEALYGWVRHLLEFWQNDLGRSMDRDVKKVSGRKQFLEFLDRCIQPLHPEIMQYNSDALDTMLKLIQADNKRGENRAIF